MVKQKFFKGIKEFAFSVVSGSSLVVANKWPLESYIVVKFRAHGINRCTHELTQTFTLIKKNLFKSFYLLGLSA
jgi:hypothetical protein